ncbi:universal stress protein [Candidatus Nitrosotenuis uzonensis]|uniref:UspA domain-containing protein n=1 Tax=Candidatus Nitrosotenuis uzonensis TaxID=1407055 RepID=V6ATI9_9ARCH|nr:universal stress protein [Candidatus Nitrosotenuis uzonensis]CDI05845.1 conserved hypothetical protein [Candidatus Nitrosotenuis uzonensis]
MQKSKIVYEHSTTMFKHILVVFVGPKIKAKSFLVGLGIAKKFNSNIFAVDCVYKHPPRFHFFETKADKESVAKQKAKSLESLKKLQTFANNANVQVTTKLVLTDAITDWVTDYVKSNRIDLLIMDYPHEPQYDIDLSADIIRAILEKVSVPVLSLRD